MICVPILYQAEGDPEAGTWLTMLRLRDAPRHPYLTTLVSTVPPPLSLHPHFAAPEAIAVSTVAVAWRTLTGGAIIGRLTGDPEMIATLIRAYGPFDAERYALDRERDRKVREGFERALGVVDDR